jgi:hypothetical protein
MEQRVSATPIAQAASRFRHIGYETVVTEGMLFVHLPDGWQDITEWVECDLIDMYYQAVLDTDGVYISLANKLRPIDPCPPVSTVEHCYECDCLMLSIPYPVITPGVSGIYNGWLLSIASPLYNQWIGPYCKNCLVGIDPSQIAVTVDTDRLEEYPY